LGFKTELKSISKVDGKETYVVEVTTPQGDLTTDYYEVETGLKLKSEGKVEMQGSEIQQVTNITEYKEFGGIKFATKVNQAVNQQSFEINVENIEINPEIEEAIFEL
jgi:hypothetical protein